MRHVNLAVQLNKPIIPLIIEQGIAWPPAGSLGPILSEYLFVRFYQRPNEITSDERYWPTDKFEELRMQILQSFPARVSNSSSASSAPATRAPSSVFISYQWDKQKQVTELYAKLEAIGVSCWLDIKQMGGGDSLYEQIDTGLRNCAAVVSCVTKKYALSANCRKEVSLADALKKPIVPLLAEAGMSYPPPGPMSPVLAPLKYLDFTQSATYEENKRNFETLLMQLKQHLPTEINEKIDVYLHISAQSDTQVVHNSRACIVA